MSNISNNSLNSIRDSNINNNQDKSKQLKENIPLSSKINSECNHNNSKTNQQTQENDFNGTR